MASKVKTQEKPELREELWEGDQRLVASKVKTQHSDDHELQTYRVINALWHLRLKHSFSADVLFDAAR